MDAPKMYDCSMKISEDLESNRRNAAEMSVSVIMGRLGA